MKEQAIKGHLISFFTVLIWGTTFISTKVLLEAYHPVEILFIRFVMGLLALYLIYPKPLKGTTLRQELQFAAAGLCGVCLYYLLENIALTYTLASNVSVIISTAPFFTALLSWLFLKEGNALRPAFLLGFCLAMAGIALISFNGAALHLNPAGDLLALLASVVWAFYSILITKINGYGYHIILTTRRTFFYGILFTLPALLLSGFQPDLSHLKDPVILFNFVFLGFGASALCFVTWNLAVKLLGVVRSSIYIYLNPVITLVASGLILDEPFTLMTALGTFLTLAGLFVSSSRRFL